MLSSELTVVVDWWEKARVLRHIRQQGCVARQSGSVESEARGRRKVRVELWGAEANKATTYVRVLAVLLYNCTMIIDYVH